MNYKPISFTKTITRTYNALWVKVNFTTFTDGFQKIRKKMGDTEEDWRCFKCDEKFILNNEIGIACFKEVGNQLLCKNCAEEIKSL